MELPTFRENALNAASDYVEPEKTKLGKLMCYFHCPLNVIYFFNIRLNNLWSVSLLINKQFSAPIYETNKKHVEEF